jgi:hypothetical protein
VQADGHPGQKHLCPPEQYVPVQLTLAFNFIL